MMIAALIALLLQLGVADLYGQEAPGYITIGEEGELVIVDGGSIVSRVRLAPGLYALDSLAYEAYSFLILYPPADDYPDHEIRYDGSSLEIIVGGECLWVEAFKGSANISDLLELVSAVDSGEGSCRVSVDLTRSISPVIFPGDDSWTSITVATTRSIIGVIWSPSQADGEGGGRGVYNASGGPRIVGEEVEGAPEYAAYNEEGVNITVLLLLLSSLIITLVHEAWKR